MLKPIQGKKVESIPPKRRNDALQGMIDLRLKRLGELSVGDMERETFALLVNKFKLVASQNGELRDNLALASKIAAGALSGDAVVDALVKSFVDMNSKLQRGKTKRVCTSRYFSSELAADLVCTVGGGSSLRSMLKPLC